MTVPYFPCNYTKQVRKPCNATFLQYISIINRKIKIKHVTCCWDCPATCNVPPCFAPTAPFWGSSLQYKWKYWKYIIYRVSQEDFGRVFLMLKYTDITQNTYVQSWTVTEIMAREKCGLLAGPRTVPVSWQILSMFVLECGVIWRKVRSH